MKISKEIFEEVKAKHGRYRAAGLLQRDICKMYGFSKQTLKNIEMADSFEDYKEKIRMNHARQKEKKAGAAQIQMEEVETVREKDELGEAIENMKQSLLEFAVQFEKATAQIMKEIREGGVQRGNQF